LESGFSPSSIHLDIRPGYTWQDGWRPTGEGDIFPEPFERNNVVTPALADATTVVQRMVPTSNDLSPRISPLRNFLISSFNKLKTTATSVYDNIAKIIDEVVLDIENFNWFNEDEQVVLHSNIFSAYKGQLVIRHNFNDRSMSLGIMFLQKYENSADIVRHERGHLDQMLELGFLKYLVGIGIPSVTSEVVGSEYYNQPHEIGADYSGGVSREYPLDALVAGEEYMRWLKENDIKTILNKVINDLRSRSLK
jgi:hypothetical protein